jgi:rhodanese-related sulfurtransferase
VNFLIDNWMLLALALASGFALLLPVLTKGSGLDPHAMVQLMNRDKAVVIDVCEPDEFARGHVIGAKNVPLGQIDDKLAQVVKNKSTQVIMVCQVGARSARAAAAARKLGYENAHSLSGGLRAWLAASMPTEKA